MNVKYTLSFAQITIDVKLYHHPTIISQIMGPLYQVPTMDNCSERERPSKNYVTPIIPNA